MATLIEIKTVLAENKTSEAIEMLSEYIRLNPKDDEAYFIIGNIYRKFNDWRKAMNAYCQAIELNPNSPAKEAYNQAKEILDFYHHD